MIQELLYTSAPKGLKPGSRGFCTVLSSSGMPAPVAVALEGLSGYRPVYSPDDPDVDLNPIVYSHLHLPLNGKKQSILSRIADYGLDYSHRTNKIAHHIALERADRPRVGPAWLLQAPGCMWTEWDGELAVVTPGRDLPQGQVQPQVCTAWRDATGDAGWAGVLAESFLKQPDRLVYIIYEPGMQMLPLIQEATALLPTDRRWDVTFSTYFTKLPKEATCQWRCVLADSPEANASRRHVQALRINLCEPVPAAVGGDLVETARTGISKTPISTKETAISSATSSILDDVEDDQPIQLKASGPPPKIPSRTPRIQGSPTRPPFQAKQSGIVIWTSVAVLFLLIAGGVIFAVNRRDRAPAENTVAVNEQQKPVPETTQKSDPPTASIGKESKAEKVDSEKNKETKLVGETETSETKHAEAASQNEVEADKGMKQNGTNEGGAEAKVTATPEPDATAPETTPPGLIYWTPTDEELKQKRSIVIQELKLPMKTDWVITCWQTNATGDFVIAPSENNNKAKVQRNDDVAGLKEEYFSLSIVCSEDSKTQQLQFNREGNSISETDLQNIMIRIQDSNDLKATPWWVLMFKEPEIVLADPPNLLSLRVWEPIQDMSDIEISELEVKLNRKSLRFTPDATNQLNSESGKSVLMSCFDFNSNNKVELVMAVTLKEKEDEAKNKADESKLDSKTTSLTFNLDESELIDDQVSQVSVPISRYKSFRDDPNSKFRQDKFPPISEQLFKVEDSGLSTFGKAKTALEKHRDNLKNELKKDQESSSDIDYMKTKIDDMEIIIQAAQQIESIKAACKSAQIERLKVSLKAYGADGKDDEVRVPIFDYTADANHDHEETEEGGAK